MTTKKQLQIAENCIARYLFKDAMKQLNTSTNKFKRLRHCEAFVYETEDYYVLKSYNTFIAAIDKHSNSVIDVLQYEYGRRTSSSTQQINKFVHDYTPYPHNVLRYTYVKL